MVLQADITLSLLATAVSQQFVGLRILILAELALIEHGLPFGSPQVIFQYLLSILVVNDRTFIYHNLTGIPFAIRFGILWFSRDQVVQRG